MSPEVINEQKYDERSDIWALGCLLYEMAALRPPFEASNQVLLAGKINKGRFPSLPSKYSDELYSCIRWMLNIDINKRPRIEELESLLKIRPFINEYRLDIREYQLNTFAKKYTTRMNEVKALENSLIEKEKKIKEKEKGEKYYILHAFIYINNIHYLYIYIKNWSYVRKKLN